MTARAPITPDSGPPRIRSVLRRGASSAAALVAPMGPFPVEEIAGSLFDPGLWGVLASICTRRPAHAGPGPDAVPSGTTG